MTVLEITRAVLDALGRPEVEPEILNNARAEIQDQYLDASKAQALLGWQPAWSLQAGLEATVAWYRTYLEGPR
jgi:CDP-glucose 4,6-dehydratase